MLHVQVGKHPRVGSLLFERNSQAQSPTLGETALLPWCTSWDLSLSQESAVCYQFLHIGIWLSIFRLGCGLVIAGHAMCRGSCMLSLTKGNTVSGLSVAPLVQGVYQYVPAKGEGFPEDFIPFKAMDTLVNAKY